MRLKLAVVLAIGVVMGFILTGTGLCCDIDGRLGLGYRYGYFEPDDADFKDHGDWHSWNLTYGFLKYFALEAELGYYELESQADTELDVLSGGVNLQVRLPLEKFVPYIMGGLGAQHYEYENLGVGDRSDKDNSFAYMAGAGAEYFLHDNWALNMEAVYSYGNTGGGATLDVYGWRYGAGIKYYFD